MQRLEVSIWVVRRQTVKVLNHQLLHWSVCFTFQSHHLQEFGSCVIWHRIAGIVAPDISKDCSASRSDSPSLVLLDPNDEDTKILQKSGFTWPAQHHNTQTLSNTTATNYNSVLSALCEHTSSYCTWRQNVRASLGRLWAFCWRYVCRRIFAASCVFLSINLAMCVKCAKRNCSGNHMMLPTKFTAEICKPQSM